MVSGYVVLLTCTDITYGKRQGEERAVESVFEKEEVDDRSGLIENWSILKLCETTTPVKLTSSLNCVMSLYRKE